jgi:hypothetical protein
MNDHEIRDYAVHGLEGSVHQSNALTFGAGPADASGGCQRPARDALGLSAFVGVLARDALRMDLTERDDNGGNGTYRRDEATERGSDRTPSS